MNENSSSLMPNLVDANTRYYLFNSLQMSHGYIVKYYSIIYNLLIFIFFVGGFGIFLYYRYKAKPSPEAMKARMEAEERYIVSKIRFYQDEKKKIDRRGSERITDLPVDQGQHFVAYP